MASRHGLGRGLAALLAVPPAEPGTSAPAGHGAALEIPVDAIEPNPNQPRKRFDDSTLHDLSESMKRSGVLQPVVVRRKGMDRYQLVIGERRWRAAKLAGLTSMPAIVREADDAETLELALVENILREDLNPMEEAEAYQRLLAEFGWTQEQLAERVGKDRSSVANCLRLLKLAPEIQADLRTGRLTMGHARALLALPTAADQLRLRAEILEHSWSVRATEERVERKRLHPTRRASRRSAELVAIEDALRRKLATRVRIVGSEQRGRIEVVYASREELDRVVEHLGGAI
jgi:ParB family transcriptional regulator, chromosome partitioning protein